MIDCPVDDERPSPRTPTVLPIPLRTRGTPDYSKRTHAQLVRDVNVAHDEIRSLRHDLKWGQYKRWMLSAAVIGVWELARLLMHH